MSVKDVLIVQFRTDMSEKHEQKCFRESLGIPNGQIKFVSAIHGKLTPELLKNAKALILGGSGEFYISEGDGKDSWLPRACDFVAAAVKSGKPVLGICFGYQVLALSQGARIARQNDQIEVGTFEVEKYLAGNDDLLLKNLPHKFMAQFGHKDVVVNWPPDFLCLARSNRVGCEAYRLVNKPVWGVLYHPELKLKNIHERVAMYPEYLENGTDRGLFTGRFTETPEASKTLDYFMQYALNGRVKGE